VPRLQLTICAGLAALAFVAGGCGGGDDQTAAEAWTDDVCSSVNTWAEEVDETRATLEDPSNLSVDTFTDALDSVVAATQTLLDDFRDLEAPETEAAAEVEAQVAQLSDTLETQEQVLSDALESDSDSPAELLGKISAIGAALSAVSTAFQSTFQAIEDLDGGAELRSAFESTDSCDDARATLEALRTELEQIG
jgi:hypothetical protein